jgi:hypothetical protein
VHSTLATETADVSTPGVAERLIALGIRFVALLPGLSPSTAVGAAGARAYAGRQGIDVSAFVAAMDRPLTADPVGAAVAELAAGADHHPAHGRRCGCVRRGSRA